MSFFQEINVTELRDGITSLHGIHETAVQLLGPKTDLISSVGSMVAPLTGWYWVRIPIWLALHLHITSSCV